MDLVTDNFQLTLECEVDEKGREIMKHLYENNVPCEDLPVMSFMKLLTYDCSILLKLNSSLKAEIKKSKELFHIQQQISHLEVTP